jgi:hypothetical protein
VLVIALAFGVYALTNVSAPLPTEFFGAGTSTWYMVSGDTLSLVKGQSESVLKGPAGQMVSAMLVDPSPVPAAAVAGKPPPVAIALPQPYTVIVLTQADGVKENLGLGRPLGFLPDNSLLAFTPLGLTRIDVVSYTSTSIISTGGTGVPQGAVSKDFSIIAFVNTATDVVDVYQFNPSTRAALYLGSLNVLPSALGIRGTTVYAIARDGSVSAVTVTDKGLVPVTNKITLSP